VRAFLSDSLATKPLDRSDHLGRLHRLLTHSLTPIRLDVVCQPC
jgi:hypothetical protein